jgi:hypothetical protein
VGTAPSTQVDYNTLVKQARVRLANCLAPEGEAKNLLGDPDFVGSGAIFNTNVFNSQALISEQNKSGLISTWGGFDWRESQLTPSHTVGTYAGSGAVNGATQSGSSVITNGWTSGSLALKAGDTVTFAGVYDVNDVTKKAFPYLK